MESQNAALLHKIASRTSARAPYPRALLDKLFLPRPTVALIGSPDEVAEQMLAIHRRLGVNHLVMSTEWAGMPKSLAIETMEMIASELIPRVRQGL